MSGKYDSEEFVINTEAGLNSREIRLSDENPEFSALFGKIGYDFHQAFESLRTKVASMGPEEYGASQPSEFAADFKKLVAQTDATSFVRNAFAELKDAPSKTMNLQAPPRGLSDKGSDEMGVV
jgi:hypothetical protein